MLQLGYLAQASDISDLAACQVQQAKILKAGQLIHCRARDLSTIQPQRVQTLESRQVVHALVGHLRVGQ